MVDFVTSFESARYDSSGKQANDPSHPANPVATLSTDAYGNYLNPNMRTGNYCAILGDSFTSHNFSQSYQQLDWGYFNWAQAFAGYPFTLTYNGGVSGNTTTQILTRVPNVLASNASWCFVNGGINDASASVPVATIVANLQSICSQIMNAGIRVIFLSLGPHATYNTTVQQVNQQMIEYCATTGNGVIYADVYSATVNPTDVTGAWNTGMSDDLLHPNAKGARAYGVVLSNILKTYLQPNIKLPSSAANSYAIDPTQTQLNANPLMTGTTGTVSGTGASGTVATSWTAGTATGTITSVWLANQTRSDGIGSNQQVTFSAQSGGAASCNIRQNGQQAKFSIGDTVYASVALTTSSMAGLASLYIQLQFTIDGTTYTIFGNSPNGTSTTVDQTNLTINLQTIPFKLTGTTITATNLALIIGFDATNTAAGVVTIGRFGLYKN